MVIRRFQKIRTVITDPIGETQMDRRSLLSLSVVLIGMPRMAQALVSPPGARPLALVNAHTGESFNGPYRDDNGPVAGAMAELSHFLRDFHCGAEIAIDVAVLDFLTSVMASVGASSATILSAYRTPATNAMLMRTTFGVAEHSQHLFGRALDVYLPSRLEEAMLAARAMKRGGVGWYPQSGFIHLDSGPVRNWTLEGHGFGHLLLDAPSPWFHEPISISPAGEIVVDRSGQPVTVPDRLAIHRLLDKAIGVPSQR